MHTYTVKWLHGISVCVFGNFSSSYHPSLVLPLFSVKHSHQMWHESQQMQAAYRLQGQAVMHDFEVGDGEAKWRTLTLLLNNYNGLYICEKICKSDSGQYVLFCSILYLSRLAVKKRIAKPDYWLFHQINFKSISWELDLPKKFRKYIQNPRFIPLAINCRYAEFRSKWIYNS